MKQNYTNKDIDYVRNTHIVEYDMKSAGLTVLKNEGLIDDVKYDELLKLDKLSRNRKIGLMCKYDSKIKKIINEKIPDIMSKFISVNEIPAGNIISIKKDAVFVIKCDIQHMNVEGYEFVAKNIYTSFVRLNRAEFYVSSEKNIVETKGLPHTDLQFIKDISSFLLMSEKLDDILMLRVLREYRSKYINLELPFESYRNILTNTFILDEYTSFDNVDAEDLWDIDTSFNYMFYFIPLVNFLV